MEQLVQQTILARTKVRNAKVNRLFKSRDKLSLMLIIKERMEISNRMVQLKISKNSKPRHRLLSTILMDRVDYSNQTLVLKLTQRPLTASDKIETSKKTSVLICSNVWKKCRL